MDPRLFLDQAKSLADVPDGKPESPAAHRTAISRAYYAAYNAAVAFIKRLRIDIVNNKDAHAEIAMSFKNCEIDCAKQFGILLSTLRTQRNYADYDMDDLGPERQKTAETAYCNSDDAILNLTKCGQSANFDGIRTAIRAWAKSITQTFKVNP